MKHLIVIATFCLPFLILSQELPSKLDKKSIFIGELNTVTLDASGLPNEVTWPSSITFSGIRATKEGNDTIEIEVLRLVLDSVQPKFLRVEFTTWDTGVVTILPLALALPDSVVFDPQLIWVRMPDINPEGDIMDIEAGDIYLEGPWFDWPWWVWVLIGLFTAAGITYFIYLKKRRKVSDLPERELTLTELTHARLVELYTKELWRKGNQKLHFIELTDIMRNYIHLRYGIDTLEKTTRELNQALRGINVPAMHVDILTAVLQQADMVKFAKLTLDESEVEVVNKQCFNWIVLTEAHTPKD